MPPSNSVLLLAATHRPESRTLQVAQAYAQLLSQAGVPHTLVDFQDLPRDFLFSDAFGQESEGFAGIRQLVAQAQTLVFFLPEYNGSFPGVAKAFIDALNPQDYLHGKQAALVGLSAGRFGNVRGLEHFTGVLNYVRMEVLPYKAHLMKVQQDLDAEGQLSGPSLKELKAQVVALLPRLHQPA